MFSYMDADEGRPSLEAMMELYWSAMPEYQVRAPSPKPLLQRSILVRLHSTLVTATAVNRGCGPQGRRTTSLISLLT